ncbi:MAG: branched-chain amino acid ABC transporter permease [Bacillota bacterium]|nr:branched-chain amino acid ABC transporter permease [Bacillota bacterium]
MKLLQKKNIIGLAAIIIAYFAVQLLMDQGIIEPFYTSTIYVIGINIILAVSLNLITGFTGQFSLGHAGFMSIGAFTSAVVISNFNQSFAVSILLAAFTAAAAGVLIGIPTLRLNGDYLAIATLGFGEIIAVIIQNNDYLGGAAGFNDIPLNINWAWVYFSVVITVLLISNFVKSYQGRACIAIREDEIAAEAMGVNTTYYKVLAFVIGAAFAGVAGALYGSQVGIINPKDFQFAKSIDILVMVVFGGMGSIMGSIIGATSLAIISMLLQDSPEGLRLVIYAVILFLIMLFRPQGLLGKTGPKFLKRRLKADAGAQSKKTI